MRKGVACLLLVLAVAVLGGCNSFGPSGSKLLYEERFSQAAGNSWYIGEDEAYRWWIAEGKYHYESQPDQWRAVKNPVAGQFRDFELKVEVEHLSGVESKTSPFILFRVVDWDNYYRFFVTPGGTFALEKRVAGTWTTLKGWTSHEAIHRGPGINRVSLVAQGSQLTFFVNGQQVYQTSDDSLGGGQIGVGCGSHTGNTPFTSRSTTSRSGQFPKVMVALRRTGGVASGEGGELCPETGPSR